MNKLRKGITFIEILASMVFLGVSLGFVLTFFTHSNQGTMDAYRETMAFTLAQEGIELVAGMGYEELSRPEVIENIAARFSIGAFQQIKNITLVEGLEVEYPDEYLSFERKFEFDHSNDHRLIKVTVTVQPYQGLASGFFRKQKIVLSKLVGADYD
jgi:hypothetical protein